MRLRARVSMAGLTGLAVIAGVGCTISVPRGGGGGGTPTVDAPFTLQGDTAVFVVQAGVPAEKRIEGSFEFTGFTPGSGALKLDPDSIHVMPDSADKSATALQANQTILITAWVRSLEQNDEDCAVGDQYGPYEVVFDSDGAIVSVTPASIALTQNTLDLLEGGELSICIRVEAPFDGTVEILQLIFTVGK